MNDDVEATVALHAVGGVEVESAVESDVEATTFIRPSGPIFVDGSGRRRRRIKVAAYVAGTVCALYMGVVGVSLAAHQETPLLPLPGLGNVVGADPESAGILEAHDGEAQPSRTPAKTVAPMDDALKRVVAPMASTAPVTSAPPTTTVAPTTSAGPPTSRTSRTSRTRTTSPSTTQPPADPNPGAPS